MTAFFTCSLLGAAGRYAEAPRAAPRRAVRVPAGRRAALPVSIGGGRLAIVVAAAAVAPGGRHATSFAGEVVVTKFRRELEEVKRDQLAYVDRNLSPPSPGMQPVLHCAVRCVRLIDVIVLTEPMGKQQFEEVANAGESFLRVASQCVQGYVTAKALNNANKALDVVAALFYPTFEIPKKLRNVKVAPAGDVLNKRHQKYLKHLRDAFVSKGFKLTLVGEEKAQNVEPWIQFDGEEALRKLKLKLETFQFTHFPMATISIPHSNLFPEAVKIANDTLRLLESILNAAPVDEDEYEVLLGAGKAVASIAVQCRQGYLRAASLVEATDALKMVGDCFLPSFELPIEHISYRVPYTSDGLHEEITPGIAYPSLNHSEKQDFFQEVLKAFICYYRSISSAAIEKYQTGVSED